MTENPILFDKDGISVVQLSREITNFSQEETRAKMVPDKVTFYRFFQDIGPRKFDLTADEADVFAAQWFAYRAEQKAKEQAEQKRQQALISEAYSIAAQCPAIEIEHFDSYYQTGKPAWNVSVPCIAWGHQGPVGNPADFLKLVKGALSAYRNHQKLIAAGGDAA